MENNNKEPKKMIIDGQIVDLDNMQLADLRRIQEKLKEKEKELKAAIQKELER